MSVSRIDHDSIYSCIHQSLHTFHCIRSHSHTRSHTQTPFRIFASHWFIFRLGYILISYQTDQFIVFINHRELLYLMFLQDLCSRFQISRLISGNQIIFCHHLIDTLVHITFKTKVTIRYNSNKISIVIYYRNTANLIFSHQSKGITNSGAFFNSHRIVNHTIFGTFNRSDLLGLFFN